MADPILERALGTSFAVSIATAEAIEKKILVENRKYNNLWINVRTLARNFWGSYSKETRVPLAKMKDAFIEELSTIESLSLYGVEIYYYAPSYASLRTGFKRANFKVPKTDNQKEYDLAENTLMKWAIESPNVKVIECDSKIPASGGSAYLMTHFPVDLLSRFAFEFVELLESSTGVSKLPQDWNTKINLPKDYVLMPFNELTLQVFGDKGKHFVAQPAAIRKELIQVAKEGKWKVSTRKEMMRLTIKKMENVAVADMFLQMLFDVIR